MVRKSIRVQIAAERERFEVNLVLRRRTTRLDGQTRASRSKFTPQARCTQAPPHCLAASGNAAELVRRRSTRFTSNLSLSAAIWTLMDFRTIAPTYFVMGNPFPIDLRVLEHSIPRLPVGLVKLPLFFTFCLQELEIAGQLENVAHI